MPVRMGGWLIVLVVGVAAVFGLWRGAEWADPIGQGTPAPAFSLPRLGDGTPLDLTRLRGRVVLLNFWATWCKPCEDEMPAMERLYRRLQGSGFELLAVSVDSDSEEVERFRERLGLSFPILLDPEQRVAGAYQTFRFPESLLIDAEGVIVERYVGPKRWDAEAYVERIRRLLPPAVPSRPA